MILASYYLFQEHVLTFQDALDGVTATLFEVQLRSAPTPPLEVVAYQLQGFPHAASWFKETNLLADLDAARALSQSPGFLLFAKVKKRIVAIAIGSGQSAIQKHLIESDFGILTALKLLPEAHLRQAKMVRPGSRRKVFDLSRQYDASPRELLAGMDLETCSRAGGKLKIGNDKEIEIGGADSLRYLFGTSTDSLLKIAQELIDTYTTGKMPPGFTVLNLGNVVRSAKEREELFAQLFDKLVAKDESGLDVIVPMLGFEWPVAYGLGSGKKEQVTYYERVSDLLHIVEHYANTFESFTKRNLTAHFESGVAREFPLRNLISFAGFESNGSVYTLDEGIWSRLTEEHIKRVREAAGKLPVRSPLMADWLQKEQEPTYLSRWVTDYGVTKCCLFHESKNHFFAQGDETEVCDIATDQKELIFVKKGATFNHLSYLCEQALTTADMLDSSQDFAKHVNAKSGWNHDFSKMSERVGVTFTIAPVDERVRTDATDYSFNCQVLLKKTMETIGGYGFSAQLAPIRRYV